MSEKARTAADPVSIPGLASIWTRLSARSARKCPRLPGFFLFASACPFFEPDPYRCFRAVRPDPTPIGPIAFHPDTDRQLLGLHWGIRQVGKRNRSPRNRNIALCVRCLEAVAGACF